MADEHWEAFAIQRVAGFDALAPHSLVQTVKEKPAITSTNRIDRLFGIVIKCAR